MWKVRLNLTSRKRNRFCLFNFFTYQKLRERMIKTTNYLVRGRIVTDFFELGEAEAEAWLCETGENSGGV